MLALDLTTTSEADISMVYAGLETGLFTGYYNDGPPPAPPARPTLYNFRSPARSAGAEARPGAGADGRMTAARSEPHAARAERAARGPWLGLLGGSLATANAACDEARPGLRATEERGEGGCC